MTTKISRLGYPERVNEIAARLTAGGVLAMSTTALVTHQRWLLAPLAYGFVARSLAGPRFSPLARLAGEVIAPRIPVAPKPVAGAPKRFAQGMGAAMSVAALACAARGLDGAADALLGMLVAASALESLFAFCVGCKIFAAMMRFGVISEAACPECADISLRARRASVAA